MTTPRKIVCIAGAVILFFILGLVVVVVNSHQRPTAHVAFSCLGVSTSSNGTLISIGITNQSASAIVYLVGPLQLKSNGVWNAAPLPPGAKLVRLAAGRSSTAMVTKPLVSGESRVPVLWGFTYSAKATRWQEIKEDAFEYLRMRNLRGRGALYTNYVTDIRL